MEMTLWMRVGCLWGSGLKLSRTLDLDFFKTMASHGSGGKPRRRPAGGGWTSSSDSGSGSDSASGTRGGKGAAHKRPRKAAVAQSPVASLQLPPGFIALDRWDNAHVRLPCSPAALTPNGDYLWAHVRAQLAPLAQGDRTLGDGAELARLLAPSVGGGNRRRGRERKRRACGSRAMKRQVCYGGIH